MSESPAEGDRAADGSQAPPPPPEMMPDTEIVGLVFKGSQPPPDSATVYFGSEIALSSDE